MWEATTTVASHTHGNLGCTPANSHQLTPHLKCFHFTHSSSKVEFYFHVSVTVSLRNFPPIVGRVLIVMDSNVHDMTEPMDDTGFEDSTCQSSESSRTIVNPEADVTEPMDDTEFEDSTCQSSELSRTIVNPEADMTEPMDNTEFEDSTCQSSESSRTIVNPEASQTSHTPAQKQCQSCYWQQFQLTGSSQPQNFGYSKCIHLSFFPKFCRGCTVRSQCSPRYRTVHYITVQCITSQNSTVQYSTVQYSTVQYSTVQYSTVQYSTVQYSTVQYSTVQYSTVQCSTVQFSAIQYRAV